VSWWVCLGVWERPRERETAARSVCERNAPVLPLLDLEVIEKHGEHILRANGLGNVTESVDCRAPDGLFVRLRMGFSIEGLGEGGMRGGKGTSGQGRYTNTHTHHTSHTHTHTYYFYHTPLP
jgi:hypothetical protein